MSADIVAKLRRDAQAQRDRAPEGATVWIADSFEEAAGEIERLREAIRRLAEQDATLSVVGGNVIVEMDATLTDAEREAAMTLISCGEQSEDVGDQHAAATLRGLLDRLG